MRKETIVKDDLEPREGDEPNRVSQEGWTGPLSHLVPSLPFICLGLITSDFFRPPESFCGPQSC